MLAMGTSLKQRANSPETSRSQTSCQRSGACGEHMAACIPHSVRCLTVMRNSKQQTSNDANSNNKTSNMYLANVYMDKYVYITDPCRKMDARMLMTALHPQTPLINDCSSQYIYICIHIWMYGICIYIYIYIQFTPTWCRSWDTTSIWYSLGFTPAPRSRRHFNDRTQVQTKLYIYTCIHIYIYIYQ